MKGRGTSESGLGRRTRVLDDGYFDIGSVGRKYTAGKEINLNKNCQKRIVFFLN